MFAKVFWAAVALGLTASQQGAAQPLAQAGGARTFVAEEATISGIHGALASRDITCVQVVKAYLDRIETYDDRGPALNAIISINPAALATAAELDRLQTARGASLRPLHCIPIILKDNYDTADMPTTGGSVTLASSIPLRDAFVVRKLREAGAIRQSVMNAIAENKLDAILYPHQRRLVFPIGEDQMERNGVLSNGTGLPALTFPGGFSPPTSSAPLGVPVGIEILGPDYSEPSLIGIAFAFEQLARTRRAPASTPPLGR